MAGSRDEITCTPEELADAMKVIELQIVAVKAAADSMRALGIPAITFRGKKSLERASEAASLFASLAVAAVGKAIKRAPANRTDRTDSLCRVPEK